MNNIQNRMSWSTKNNEERHKGSYDLEEIRNSELYKDKLNPDCTSVKRKYAICFGYLGTNYQGLQINPGIKTIEAELEKALYLCGSVIEENFGFLHKIQFTRAARTDSGVHAVTQCCAMKLLVPISSKYLFLEQLNKFLPPDIKAHTMTKVSKAFNSKSHCTKRSYYYLLPTYTLESVIIINQLFEKYYEQQGAIRGAGYEGGYIEEQSIRSLNKGNLVKLREIIKDYRINEEKLSLLREALKLYEGTKAYHNFTKDKHPDETNSKRFILTFECGDPYIDNTTGIEWILLTVTGQSFLLHQIRKMVSLAIEVTRGSTSITTIKDAFLNRKMDLPLAPSVGLYLGKLFFDGYNAKQRKEIENDKRLSTKKLITNKHLVSNEVSQQQQQTNSSNSNNIEIVDNDDEAPLKKSKIEISSNENSHFNEVGNDDDTATHQEIDWYNDPNDLVTINKFRDEVIHPHIMEQELASLHYMYYLDYLRAYPHLYDKMNKPYGPLKHET